MTTENQTTTELEKYVTDLKARIEANRVRLLSQMTAEEREYVKDMPAWQMPYVEYHQTLISAGISNG